VGERFVLEGNLAEQVGVGPVPARDDDVKLDPVAVGSRGVSYFDLKK